MRTCFQGQFSSISCIFNSSKHVPVAKKWQKRRKRVLTNCNHAKSDGNVVSTKTFAWSHKKTISWSILALFDTSEPLMNTNTLALDNYTNYSRYQKGNKSVFCNGSMFWQIVFRPKVMGTCFGNGNAFYKFEANENATGTHLQKLIFGAFKGRLWP